MIARRAWYRQNWSTGRSSQTPVLTASAECPALVDKLPDQHIEVLCRAVFHANARSPTLWERVTATHPVCL